MASDNYQYSTLEVAIDVSSPALRADRPPAEPWTYKPELPKRTDGIEYDTSPEPVVLAPSAPKYDSAPEPVLLSPNSQKYDASSRGSVVLSPNSQKYDTSPEPVFITPVTPKFPPIGPPVDNQANAGFNDFAQVTGSPEPKRPWWKAKRVWVTAVVAVVVVAALLGGLLGYFLHKKATSSSATAAAAGDTGPLANSRLAAMNWTDSNKVERKAVFYQYDGALLYTQYDASNDTWASVNLTQSFARDNNGTILDVKPGTPLAVAVPSKDVIDWWDAQFGGPTGWWQVNLFYMDNDNHLRDIVTSDDNLGSWSEGELGASAIEADEESQLSAFAYYCAEGSVTSDGDLESTACSLYPALTYQNTDQRFVVIWGGDWSSENDTTVLDKSVQGADYAMLPYASDGTNRSDISSYDVFYYSDGAMSYYMYDAVTESYNGSTLLPRNLPFPFPIEAP